MLLANTFNGRNLTCVNTLCVYIAASFIAAILSQRACNMFCEAKFVDPLGHLDPKKWKNWSRLGECQSYHLFKSMLWFTMVWSENVGLLHRNHSIRAMFTVTPHVAAVTVTQLCGRKAEKRKQTEIWRDRKRQISLPDHTGAN